jgi:hypothetical protein
MATFQTSPLDQNLFVATPNAIHLRSQLGRKTLFECETANGIVNARASKDNSSLFAVADGQVVILHDATRGQDRKYKLRNGDVLMACLLSGRGLQTNRSIGRATSPLVLTRLAHTILHDDTEQFGSSILHTQRRASAFLALAPVPAQRNRNIQ